MFFGQLFHHWVALGLSCNENGLVGTKTVFTSEILSTILCQYLEILTVIGVPNLAHINAKIVTTGLLSYV